MKKVVFFKFEDKSNKYVHAIKYVRHLSGMSLKEGKALVDESRIYGKEMEFTIDEYLLDDNLVSEYLDCLSEAGSVVYIHPNYDPSKYIDGVRELCVLASLSGDEFLKRDLEKILHRLRSDLAIQTQKEIKNENNS